MLAPEQIPVPPVRGGSVEICMYEIAKRLAEKHNVTIISRRHKRLPAVSHEGNLTIIRVPSGKKRTYLKHVKRRIKGMAFDWIQIDNRPLFIPVIRKLFPHTPIALFLHSLTFVSASRLSHSACVRCLDKADLIVANSISLQKRLAARFPTAGPKLNHVWLGADLSRFRPPSPSERESIRSKYRLSGSFVVSFVGRLIPRKGLPLLIKAVHLARKRHPAIKLVVAGGSQVRGYSTKLKRIAARHKVPVVFLGTTPHSRIHSVYWMADCFICPSQQHEAFGLVNVEAMASGLPCIASNIGGIREIIHDGHTGLLVDHYRSPQAFAEKLLAVVNNQGLSRRMGMRAREDVIKRFNWRSTAINLSRLYRKSATIMGEEEIEDYEIDGEQMDQDSYSYQEQSDSTIYPGNEENDEQQCAGHVEQIQNGLS